MRPGNILFQYWWTDDAVHDNETLLTNQWPFQSVVLLMSGRNMCCNHSQCQHLYTTLQLTKPCSNTDNLQPILPSGHQTDNDSKQTISWSGQFFSY